LFLDRRDEIGQIEGVVRTEAGFIGGREVTLVDMRPNNSRSKSWPAARNRPGSRI